MPVGVHEVRAVKQYHTFENEGKITNSDGTDRNYQDRVTGIELTDITTVRYIGRVAGGAVQEAFPVGHSLSTNNLGDGLAVTLTYQNDAYVLANEPRTETLAHFDGKHANEVAFSQNVITIYPDKETGEFVADVLPERFRVNVAVAGHDDMPGDGGELNLTNAFIEETSVYDYEVMLPDSTTEAHSDTVRYHMMQQFIKRYPPTVGVTQLDDAGQPLPYFGDSTYAVNTADASRSYSVRLYDGNGGYAFGMPVFEQLAQKRFGVSVYEEYIYKDEEGNDKDGVQPDRVPTTDARVTFGGDLPFGEQTELEVDSAGYVEYTFQVNDPELTAAVRSISATMVYGDTDNPTSIPWDGFDAVVLGAHLRGTDFITAGPDQILFVLRDPPGSNSYAYLEKGVTVDKTSAYVGNVSNTLSEVLSTKAGATVITFAGLGGGTIISSEVENEIGAGVTNAQTVGGSDTKHWLTETTTRFQTSADPAYVGADGDLYVGYSTNTSFGVTDNVVFVPRATYDANPGDYAVYTGITPVEPGAEWLLVNSTGMGISQNFATLFAYPQVHIEQRLIPQIEEFRNNLLHQQSEGLDFQALANQQNSAVYVSKLLPDDPNYGKSNSDDAFTHADNEDVFDGQSYKIYFPEGTENNLERIILSVVIAVLNMCKSYLASGALMSIAVEDRPETIDSLRRCRRVGVALVLAVMAMSSTVARLVLQGSGAVYPGALIYGYAGYAFIMIVLAIVNLARARRLETLAVKGVRALNLAGALTSIFALQTVLLSRVTWELLPDGVSRDVVEGSLGGLVCLCLLIMGLWLALAATGRLVERRGDELRFRIGRRPRG